MIIRQLTNNNYADYNPVISGNNIAWSGFGDPRIEIFEGNYQTEVFFYNGSEIIRLTNNDVGDRHPDIYGTDVIWQSEKEKSGIVPSNFENWSISFFDGTEIFEVPPLFSSYQLPSSVPKISNGNVAWRSPSCGGPAVCSVIAYFDGNNTQKFGRSSFSFDLSGDNLVWNEYIFIGETLPSNQIFLYDKIQTERITTDENDVSGSSSAKISISGNNIVWQENAGNDAEIFLFDGINIRQITDNDIPDEVLQISENNIIWRRNFGVDNPVPDTIENTSEIIFYNGTNETQLTNNNVAELNVQISGKNVVWQQGEGNEAEIFAFNGSRVIQLTNNNIPDENPEISEDNVVWQRTINGESDIATTEIFTTSLAYTTETENESYLYRFRNTKLNTGTYLFVNDTEANAILSNPNYKDIFELEGGNGLPFNDIPAFKVSTQPEDNLIGIYRLRNQAINGTYLFVNQGEYNQIFADNSPYKDLFIPEGLNENGVDIADFYVYGAGSNQGIVFNRFRNVNNNTYLFVGESETNAILNDAYLSSVFAFEGVAFEGLI